MGPGGQAQMPPAGSLHQKRRPIGEGRAQGSGRMYQDSMLSPFQDEVPTFIKGTRGGLKLFVYLDNL